MKILIRQPGEDWSVVESASYLNEAELQRLLAESPALISISDIRPEAGPLVLTVREIGLPGSGSTDVIGFTALGDIAVVECKLAANAEIKRKVIGLALEYGAFLWGMTYEDLDQRVQLRRGKSLADLVRAAVGDESWDEEAFRAGVAQTLAVGTFILIIAVDAMNPELARTVNFLNNCGNPAFAFAALEMRRFQGGTTEILVPEVLGGAVAGPKPTSPPKTWNEQTFLAALTTLPEAVSTIIRDLYAWTRSHADQVQFGQGKQDGSITFKLRHEGHVASVFALFTNGKFWICFGSLSDHLPTQDVLAFDQAVAAIPVLHSMTGDVTRWPIRTIAETFLANPDALENFKSAVLQLKNHLATEPRP